MTAIAFIGLGHMGAPMAQNLIQKGHDVALFDLNHEAVKNSAQHGGTPFSDVLEACRGREVVISMLPEGSHCRQLYLGEEGLIENLTAPSIIIDCSTIDMETSQELHTEAQKWGHQFLDAPVSGGVTGAKSGKLTFMVGGTTDNFTTIHSILQCMGKNVFHAGEATHGLAAKICNNLMLGIHMVGTSEAFILANRLGLANEKLYEIACASSGQSWTLLNYCPAPGILPSSPANNNYIPGFTGEMMLKDLNLAVDAAHNEDISIPLTEKAKELYDEFCHEYEGQDFSGIIQYLDNQRF